MLKFGLLDPEYRWLLSVDDDGDDGDDDGAAGSPPSGDGGEEDDDGDTKSSAAGDDADDKKPADDHWAVKRLGKVSARAKALQQENERLRREAAERAKPAKDDEKQEAKPGYTDEEVEARAEQKARERQFTADVNAAVTAGRKEFGASEFDTAIRNYAALGGTAAMEQESGFLSAALATDDPAKVLYALAEDLDEAERIMSLGSPLRMVSAMSKLTAEAKPGKRRSKSPEPVKPVGGTVETSTDARDEDSVEAWMQKRNAHVRKTGRKRLIGLG